MDRYSGTAVQKQMAEATTEQIARDLRELRDKGLVEEAAIRTPFGKTDTYRFKISPAGIEYLQSLEEKGPAAPGVSAKEIESRLVETYDRIKADWRPCVRTWRPPRRPWRAIWPRCA